MDPFNFSPRSVDFFHYDNFFIEGHDRMLSLSDAWYNDIAFDFLDKRSDYIKQRVNIVINMKYNAIIYSLASVTSRWKAHASDSWGINSDTSK